MQERIDYIMRLLEERGSVRVADISKQLDCSEVTIRADLKRMEQRGMLKRIHGGAVSVETQLMIPFSVGNVMKHPEKKKRIAAQAYSYINDGETIILDDSSVCYYLAKCIEEDNGKHVIVITNSLAVAAVLSLKPHVDLVIVGGQVMGKLPCTMGELAIDTISKLHADKAFISAHGLNFAVGITSIGSNQMHVKKAILEAAKDIFLMIDSSKFEGGYVQVVCPLEGIHTIITDDGIDKRHIVQAQERAVRLDVV